MRVHTVIIILPRPIPSLLLSHFFAHSLWSVRGPVVAFDKKRNKKRHRHPSSRFYGAQQDDQWTTIIVCTMDSSRAGSMDKLVTFWIRYLQGMSELQIGGNEGCSVGIDNSSPPAGRIAADGRWPTGLTIHVSSLARIICLLLFLLLICTLPGV